MLMTGLAPADKHMKSWSAVNAGRGFTLIELIAVMVMIAVLSASAGPVLSTVASQRQALAATSMRKDIAYARQLAVATGSRTWVVFDTSAQTYKLYKENPDNPGKANRVIILDPATSKDFIVHLGTGDRVGVTISSLFISLSNTAEIGFDYLGRPLIGNGTLMTANATITLSSGAVIKITGRTGRISEQ